MLYKYSIKCPECETEVDAVIVDTRCFLVKCDGCQNVLVIDDVSIYSVSGEFFKKIVKKHSFKVCGNIIDSRIHRFDGANSAFKQKTDSRVISNTDIQELSSFLEKSQDSLDILKKYW